MTPRALRRYAVVVVALLVVNRLVAGARYGGPSRETIAYSPLFLDQVQAGNASEIASTDTGRIQGVFRKPMRVPGASQPVTDFETQVPSFADDQALSTGLAKDKVTVNASSPDTGPPLLLGLGPVLLLIGAFVWLSRRAGTLMDGGGPLGAFTRVRARRVDGETTRTTFARAERWRLDGLAAAPLEHETLDQAAAYRAAGLEPPTRPAPYPVAA